MKENSNILKVAGRGIPLDGNDIDTDRIIPARFMKVVTFDGLGEHAFTDDRLQAAEKNLTHSFDDPKFQGAHILVANKNFGCGSSREHAPQALKRWGIDAIIAESFAEIFAGNCTSLGMPTLTGTEAMINQLQEFIRTKPDSEFVVDVQTALLTSQDQQWQLEIAEGVQSRLTTGQWDALGILVANMDAVENKLQALPYTNGWR